MRRECAGCGHEYRTEPATARVNGQFYMACNWTCLVGLVERCDVLPPVEVS